MRAASTLARVRKVRSSVAALARALGLAARVDVALVRRVRLALRPAVDVSAEVDLWTSPLVQARGTDAIALRPDVVALLWAELAGDRDALDAAWSALDAARRDAPPLLRLEERLTWLALRGDLADVERELGAVIAAMAAEEGRRRDLAAWSARALARLPEAVRTTEAAKVLAAAAGSWVAAPASLAALAPSPEGARLAARLGRSEGRVAISVRRVGDVLEVGDPRPPPWVTLEVPRRPLALVVDEDRVVPLERGAVTRIDVKGDPVMLGALDGRRWMLARVGDVPNLAGLTGFECAGGVGAAYLVAQTLAATSAALVRDGAPSALVFGDASYAVTVVATNEEADVALLELDRPATVFPVALSPDARQGDPWVAFGRAPVPGGGQSTVTRQQPMPQGPAGMQRPAGMQGASVPAEWRGAVAEAWPRLALHPPEALALDALPPPGTPVFVGRAVIGHVKHDPLSEGTLHLAAARTVAWWVARLTDDAKARESLVTLRWAEGPEVTGAIVAPGVALALNLPELPAMEGVPVGIRIGDDRARVPITPIEGRVDATPREHVLVAFDPARSPEALPLGPRERVPEGAVEVVLRPFMRESPPAVQRARVVGVDRERGVMHLESSAREGFASVGGIVLQRGALVGLLDRQGGLESTSASFATARLVPDAVRDWLAERAPAPPPRVVVQLASSISTAGLLAATVAREGDASRSRRHRTVLGTPREVLLDPQHEPTEGVALRVDVAVSYGGLDTPEFAAVVFEGPGLGPWNGERVVEACRAMARELPGTSPSVDPPVTDESFSGIRLYVRCFNGLPHAHACRRALRYVTGLLAALDGIERGVHHLHLRIPGVGAIDLGDVARRVEGRCGAWVRVKAVDPECDVLEALVATSSDAADEWLTRAKEVADALGMTPAGVHRQGDLDDPLDGQFGTSPERRGRRIEVTGEPHAPVVVVRSLDDRPVRGYVAFYARAEVSPSPVRVRAQGGVARWAVPTTFPAAFVVGAIVEDEGLPLETRVHLPPSRREAPA
ncbi:MAG: hypothetical protein U0324_00485 [Polyangiales bacterium]